MSSRGFLAMVDQIHRIGDQIKIHLGGGGGTQPEGCDYKARQTAVSARGYRGGEEGTRRQSPGLGTVDAAAMATRLGYNGEGRAGISG
jgi:hypothetical protein